MNPLNPPMPWRRRPSSMMRLTANEAMISDVGNGPQRSRKNQGEDDGQRIIDPQIIHKTPGEKADQDIQGAMGKIGQPAHPVDQGKTDGYQDKGHAVNGPVNEYVHAATPRPRPVIRRQKRERREDGQLVGSSQKLKCRHVPPWSVQQEGRAFKENHIFNQGGIMILPVAEASGKIHTLFPSCHCTQQPSTLVFGS